MATKIIEFQKHPLTDLAPREGCQMDPGREREDLHHRLRQLRFLASETDDPSAARLVRDLIVELEDQLTADSPPAKHSPS
jgi:hypothetical protein